MDEFKVPDLPVSGNKTDPKKNEPAQKPTTDVPRNLAAPLTYKEPKWSAPPSTGVNYKFEVLKSGQIIGEVQNLEQKPVWSFGRLPGNDVEMAHPTISRHHAVLQYKPKTDEIDAEFDTEKLEQPEGWYIYDLNSTHGTFLNKQRIPSRVYIRIRVGHMLKLGASTRTYILHGPVEDEEPESELSVTELRAQREQQVAEAAAEAERKSLEAEERERNEGASWGMGEDADEETDLRHNPYASTNNEEFFLDDPKRTLRGYFEREGLQLEYKCDEMSTGSFVCRVELPLDDSNGRPIVAEVVHKGRKKDCVVQCALEACRQLDRHGVLRQANQEPLKRKHQTKGSDSDEDEFWDRTGDIERKKQRKANAGVSVTLTYDDLIKQEGELKNQLKQVEIDIVTYHENQKRLKSVKEQQDNAGDDLDNFMDTLNDDVSQVDKNEIRRLRLEQQRIKTEQQKLQRLIKLAKPTELPLAATAPTSEDAKAQQSKGGFRQLPLIGKRNQFTKLKLAKSGTIKPAVVTKSIASDEEEFDEDEEDEEKVPINTEQQAVKKEKEADALPSLTKTIQSVDCTVKQTSQDKKPTLTSAKCELNDNLKSDQSIDEEDKKTEIEKCTNQTNLNADAAANNIETSNDPQMDESANRKRRQRARQRNNKQQRGDVDIDELEEHEDSEKYAKWVPPTNQTGDGMTALNEKFGY